MISRVLGAALAGALLAIFLLVLNKLDIERDLALAKASLEATHKEHAIALARAQDRYIERDRLAQEALDEYRKELAAAQPVPTGERLRDAIRASGDRDRKAATADCRRIENRAAAYRELLEQADDLLGEGESLAADFSGAAERHGSEVRVLLGRVKADRSPAAPR